ncbi:MAG: sigma 54-interacting transcriptional regulator [Pseudomonadales bacterium]
MNNIQLFVENLRSELQAAQVSVLLYCGSDSDRQAQLFSAGQADSIPELSDLETAEHLINGALSTHKVELFRSADSDCCLLCIPVSERQRDNDSPERRHRTVNEPSYWLGLRDIADEALLSSKFELIASTVRLCAELFASRVWRADPDTGLPDRGEYERVLETHLKNSEHHKLDLGLLLLEPNTLGIGLDVGLLQRAQRILQSVLRESDQIYRYADSILALPIPGSDEAGVQALGNKVLQALRSQHPGNEVQWSVATLHCDASAALGLRSVDCARRLEAALHRCKIQPGHHCVTIGTESLAQPDSQQLLQGIFTGEPVRDYRNMRLLWDVVERIGQCNNSAELSIDIVALVAEALSTPVALFEDQEPGLQLIASSGDLPDEPLALERLCKSTVRGDCATVAEISGLQCHGFPGKTQITAPLVLLVGDRTQTIIDCDQRLLESLIQQLASAIERLKISEQESGLRESETRQLRQQVTVLAQQARTPHPEVSSAAMQQVLRQAQMWSPTDETILITGESGVGKEIMAARVHQLSDRANVPMITVDCAAIPVTLLEAELFGKVKGAYTGADNSTEGYARKADGGTLFLDEIGELPVDVQAKLLRFVQEKQVSPVGSTDIYTVDVRIIAATNRNLQAEVSEGRFRGDLMYRLQVLELHLPPLRERQEDITPLAQYFLDVYNQQYQRHCQLTPAAQSRLYEYAWPGNVRELKHSMLKACLECADEHITPADIGFTESFEHTAETFPVAARTPDNGAVAPPVAAPVNGLDDAWEALAQSLRTSCSSAVTQGLRLPFGTWTTQTLVRSANSQSEGIAKHGAELLGMPESTYRRQLERIKQSDESGLAVQHSLFDPNMGLLDRLLQESTHQRPRPATPLVESVRALLLEIVDALVPEQSSFGAALMGVTPPTYRRHLQELKERSI